MTRMILLGVGTAVPDADRGHTHMVWDGPGGPMLIDAGGCTYQRLLKAGIDPKTLQGCILTHSHADHINGLPTLLFSCHLAGRRTPMPIYGLESTLLLAQRMLEACELEEHALPAVWTPLDDGDTLPLGAGWSIHTAQNDHSRPCLALRIENRQNGMALTYSGDTSPCPAVVALAKDATILIHEATVDRPFKGHTTPFQAGTVAAQAGARRLVLVHYSPQWTMPEEQVYEQVRASGFDGSVEIGREYQVLDLSSS